MPTEVGIIRCRGDQAASDLISQGKNATDREAKQASLLSLAQQFIVIPNIKPLYLPEEKNTVITRGSPTIRRLVIKTGLLYPSPISGHTDSYRHSSSPTHRH